MQDGMFGDFHAIQNRFYFILQQVSKFLEEKTLNTVILFFGEELNDITVYFSILI